MWVILGVIAIIFTSVNLLMYASGKDYTLWMSLGLAFTAFTLCAEYSLVSDWVEVGDWAALEDVVPGMERALWLLTSVSVLLNIAPIFLERRSKR
ncbi:hypothetical protein [Bacillus sp. KH172YL63]|uniref:hypothetical protein n=1 Tax=Bacillus sp. KH172YL63 TaxID=2709784 RepID=UPI0013E4D070|nr:hypothetical protein [Bacillus sp. KH172YL63]BCB05231.1 hypothetical protein KH172YL63_33640 [Bacillus sp. KH172YL63]